MDYRKLKGNLGLKSSALAPTACKLSSQFLVLDHMSNHYMKIARAKSAIDSGRPKSLASSQKMRDRVNRDRIVKSPQLRSHSSLSGVNVYEYEDVLRDEPEDEEEKLVHSIMRSTLLEKSRNSNIATHGSSSHMDPNETHPHLSQQVPKMVDDTHYTLPYGSMTYDQPDSVRSIKSGHSLANSASRVAFATTLSAKRPCKGDVLEKRPHLFTEPERPFTPRTLKKNTESRLKNSKCYNPPRSKHEANGEDNPEKVKTKSNKLQSPPASKKHQKDKNYSKNDLQETMGTAQHSDSMLMDITVRSRDDVYGQTMNHNVPPLAITMDKDHMNWLQEQASKAEVRVRSSGRLKSSLHPDEKLDPGYRKSDLEENLRMEKLKKDEEQKYLAFAKEVTDDVLSRGISSDSVLYRVFENHIERRKHDLDENHMRKVIRDLRKNLGLKDSLGEGQTLASLSEDNYNNRFRKDLTNVTKSSGNHHQSIKSTVVKENQKSYLIAPSEMNSTTESVSTLKFGRTGDLLSTITSEGNQEAEDVDLDREEPESEMTVTQTLKQYQHSLTAQEEGGDDNCSIQGSEPGSAAGELGIKKHSFRSESHVIGEKKLSEDDKSDTSSRRAQKISSRKGSQSLSHMETLQRINDSEVPGMTTQHNSQLENHEHSSKEISSVAKIVNPNRGSTDNHSVQDDSDVSVKSSEPSQRPVVKPRARARQMRREAAQEDEDAALVAEQTQENKFHGITESNHYHRNSLPDKADDGLAVSVLETVNTKEGAPDVNQHHNVHHQQSAEEDEEYEEDYEEVIESEDDGQEDSADDF